MSLFVQVTPDLSRPRAKLKVQDDDARRLIRSHAMMAFRKEQRNTYGRDPKAALPAEEAWRNHRKKALRPAKDSFPKSPSPKEPSPSGDDQVLSEGRQDDGEGNSSDSSSLTSPTGKESDICLASRCITDMAHSIPAYRLALTQNFVDGYFPAAEKHNSGLTSILSHWMNPTSPAFETGNDAFGLLHFGGAIGDERVLLEGQRMYSKTLQMVRRDIQRMPKLGSFESLFAAAQDLLNCEIYKVVSSGFEGWSAHISGINAIIQTPGFTKMNPAFSAFLFAQFRHAAMMYALVTRSSALLPADCYNPYLIPPSKGSIEELTRLALQLPALLETVDRAANLRDQDPDHDSTVATLSEIERKLLSWTKIFRSKHLIPHRRTKTTDQPLSTSSQPHYVALVSTFHECLLLLIYEALWKLKGQEDDMHPHRDSANRCAERLLQYIPFLEATTNGDAGKALAVRAPIYFATRWYRQSRNEETLEECEQLEQHFRESFVHLEWSALLPWSFLPMLWIA